MIKSTTKFLYEIKEWIRKFRQSKVALNGLQWWLGMTTAKHKWRLPEIATMWCRILVHITLHGSKLARSRWSTETHFTTFTGNTVPMPRMTRANRRRGHSSIRQELCPKTTWNWWHFWRHRASSESFRAPMYRFVFWM